MFKLNTKVMLTLCIATAGTSAMSAGILVQDSDGTVITDMTPEEICGYLRNDRERSKCFKRIYKAIARAIALDRSAIGTIQYLIEHGVIKLTWAWTAFERMSNTDGIEVTKVGREITDGEVNAKDDPIDLGEVWAFGAPTYEPR